MRGRTRPLSDQARAVWSRLADGWPPDLDWHRLASGRESDRYVTIVDDAGGPVLGASWLLHAGDASLARGVPCASVVLSDSAEPAVVWDRSRPAEVVSRAVGALVDALTVAAAMSALDGISVMNIPLRAGWEPLRHVLRQAGFVAVWQKLPTLEPGVTFVRRAPDRVAQQERSAVR